jgi:hypothetical protein
MGKALSFLPNTISGVVKNVPVIGDPLSKGINKVTGAIDSTLLGEKDPGTSDQVVDFASKQGRDLQEQSLGKYGEFLNQDTKQLAANQIAQQSNQARANVEDQQRKAQQMVAQRGLGSSSIGVNAILNQGANLGNQLGAIQASQPALENQMRQQNLNFATGGINQILGEQGQSKVLKLGQASKGRQGGLAPLIGAGAGAYMGGPAGAQAGLGIGQAATQL